MTDKEFEELYKQSAELTPPSELKEKILLQTSDEMENKKDRKQVFFPKTLAKIFVPIAACVVFMFTVMGVMIGLNNENYQTVYIDVNPSVALQTNRFGKVNGVEYLNEDAKDALVGVKLEGLSAEDALEKMIIAYDGAGYFDSNTEIYISTLSEKNKNADKLLAKLSKRAESIKGDRGYSVNVTKLTAGDRAEAYEYGISPGKYRVISEILEKNSNYTVEDLKDKSMAELKAMLMEGNDKDKVKDNGNGKEKK